MRRIGSLQRSKNRGIVNKFFYIMVYILFHYKNKELNIPNLDWSLILLPKPNNAIGKVSTERHQV